MMHASLCVCALIPRIETRTRVALVIHRAEIRKPTNTGVLATHCLVNSEVHVRGREDEPHTEITWNEEEVQPLLLYPHNEDSTPLNVFVERRRDQANADAPPLKPVLLIVPDGNWRQAFKVRARVPNLRNVPCVHLPAGGAPTLYRLRSEAQPTGLATMEAIARALEILEGAAEGAGIRAQMEHVFRAMVERTLWVRGSLKTSEVTGGVPEGTLKHNPRAPRSDENVNAPRGKTDGGPHTKTLQVGTTSVPGPNKNP